MTNRKTTRRALVMSLLSLLLCCSMLVGTTFAWFTDSVTSGNNKIVAGNLDVELKYAKIVDGQITGWADVKDATEIFDPNALWEPGRVEVAYLQVTNEGTLALKYQLGVNVASEIASTSVLGNNLKLSEHLVFKVVEMPDSLTTYTDREAVAAAAGTEKGLKDYNGTTKALDPKGGANDEDYVALIVYMPESVGNEANYRGTRPEITLGVKLLAAQVEAELDSFGSDYDSGATYVPAWDGGVTAPTDLEKDANNVYQLGTAADLAGFAQLVNGGSRSAKAVLNADVNLGGKEFMPIGGVSAGQSGWDSSFSGEIDGQGHTIYGLKVTEAPFAGLIGLSYGGTVKNLNIDGAHIVGGSYASGIVGYGYNKVINCKVTNSTMIASYAAPLVSYRGSDVKDCTSSNNTIVGWYVAGGIVGLSGGEPGVISGNTSENNQIYLVDYAPTSTYRGAGDIVGCATDPNTLQNNSFKNNVVEILPYAETTVIANAADLLEVAGKSKEGNLLIVDDIDLAGTDFATIGAAYGKSLNVIGNGYTISNAKLSHTTHNGMKHYGMFYAYTNSTLTVSDLTVENVNMDCSNDTERNYGVGVIVCFADGGSTVNLNNVDVYNCIIKNDKLDIGDEAGVYVGYQTGTLNMVNCDSTGCSVAGETTEKTGAFIGMVNGTATLTNCTTDLTIGACNRVAGTLTIN